MLREAEEAGRATDGMHGMHGSHNSEKLKQDLIVWSSWESKNVADYVTDYSDKTKLYIAF